MNFDRVIDKMNLKLYYKYIDCPADEETPEECDVIFVRNPDSYMFKNKRILENNTHKIEVGKKRYLARIKTNNYFDSDKVNLWYRFLIVERVDNNVIHMKILNIYEAHKLINSK